MKNKNIFLFLLVLLFISHLSIAQDFELLNTTKVVPNDRAFEDRFGSSVAISGDYAIVGSERGDNDPQGNNFINNGGAAYIYQRDANGAWNNVQKIVASDRGGGDNFGERVAISGDYAIVGVYKNDTDALNANAITEAGAVYIFERAANGTWSQVQKIVEANRSINDFFGFSVAIHGNYATVGSRGDDEDFEELNPAPSAGAAYVYERSSNGVWELDQKITAADREQSDFFGFAVAMSNDYILIGANQEDVNMLTDNEGSVYVFEKDINNDWVEKQKLVASASGVGDLFGSSVALSGDKAVIGAPQQDQNATEASLISNAGAAYVFELDTNEDWVQIQKMVASDRGENDLYGTSVSIEDSYIAVGASGKDGDIGGAYLLSRSVDGDWQEAQAFTNPSGVIEDYYGHGVALGQHSVIVSAITEEEDALEANNLKDAGSIYTYQFNSKPVANALVPSQVATEDQVYSYQFDTNLFLDLDDDPLTYTATLVQSPLPSWLSFNPDTRMFSGTPTNDHVGAISVRIYASEGSNVAFRDFQMTVANTNDAPTEIDLSNNFINENSAVGIVIGSLSTADVDLGDTHAYSLVTGTGDTDNASFAIVGMDLVTNAEIDFESKISHAIRVQTDDSEGGVFEKEFTIEVNDITGLSQSITFDPLASVLVNDVAFGLTAVASSGLTVSYSSSDESVATISGSTVTIVGAGTTSIIAIQSGDDDYATADNVEQSLAVNKFSQSITFTALADVTFGDANFELSAIASSGLTVTYASSDVSVATVSGSTVTIVGGGNTTITASQDGDSNYASAADSQETLRVNKQSQSITFVAIEDQLLEVSTLTLSAEASSGLEVSYEVLSGPATLDDNVVSFTGLGSVAIRASQEGDDSFLVAVPVDQTFEVITITGRVETANLKTSTYPNPVKNTLFIVSERNKIQQVQVLDLKGKLILSKEWTNQLEVSALKAGQYLLRINTGEEITIHKIIKQ